MTDDRMIRDRSRPGHCRECGVCGAKSAVKVDPRDYAETRMLLCDSCRVRLGFVLPLPAKPKGYLP